MEKRKKLVGDITRGYVLMDEDEAVKAHVLVDAIGKYIDTDTRKSEYNKMYKANILIDPFFIRKVIFNKPATIVYWEDGTKTVVKAVGEEFDPEKGLAMAYAKKALGNRGNYFNHFKKWTKQYAEKSEEGVG